jgi:hypothetical protein
MPRGVVGLLAAAGAIMSALVGLIHGDQASIIISGAGVATGLAAYLALSPMPPSIRTCIPVRMGLGTSLRPALMTG